MRSHSVSDKEHIPDTPRQSHLNFRTAALHLNDPADCCSKAIAANIPSFSDISSLMACCKELDQEKRSSTLL